MYNDYFGLRESPFSIAPNPQYLYMSDRHRDALAHLLYGIKSDGGFLLLTGEVGTGKTTVCRCLLEQVPNDVDTAYILNPKLTAQELLATICDDFHIEYPNDASIKILVDKLNEFLLDAYKEDRRTVLIIDEAQNLSVDVLEQLRLLTNLETNHRKLLQIILLGQPELLTLLARPELRQLSQRVTARFHLEALNQEEIDAYIQYRLEIAGAKGILFPKKSVDRIYKISKGIPRLINLICDRSLLGTYVQNQLQVEVSTINKAAEEILGKRKSNIKNKQYAIAAAALVFISVALIFTNRQEDKLVIVSAHPNPTAIQNNYMNAPVIPELSSKGVTYIPADRIKGSANRSAIFAELFDLWNINVILNASNDPCDVARVSELRCFTHTGSLHELSQLNRPVLIRFGPSSEYFIITKISGQGITLLAAGERFLIEKTDFLRRWSGTYTLLWRSSPDLLLPIKIGDSGKAVAVLHQKLRRIENNFSDSELKPQFDNDLESSLKRFQISADLVPDGIADAQTFIHINSRLDSDIPFITEGSI
ncbi:MAG: AAA family ATPase [Pseudomonadales bacterium]|nr:AAA family ATPase [Pseudomonadales bacterium]